MNRRFFFYLLPLMAFLAMSVFLYRGLYSDASELESVLVGRKVPDFMLQDLYDQDTQYSSEILSGEPMLLNVWATWCPTCRAEHSFLNRLSAQGIKIMGLNYKDDRTKAIGWLRDLGNPYSVNLYDGRGMLGLDLGVYGAPETYFIDSKGVIQYRHVGDVNPRNWADTLAPIFAAME